MLGKIVQSKRLAFFLSAYNVSIDKRLDVWYRGSKDQELFVIMSAVMKKGIKSVQKHFADYHNYSKLKDKLYLIFISTSIFKHLY